MIEPGAQALTRMALGASASALPKYAGDVARSRGSSPKLQVLNTALMTTASGLTLDEARADREYWGHLVESAVGAHLANAAMRGEHTLHYWREGNHEVDFVVKRGRRIVAIDLRRGALRRDLCRRTLTGLAAEVAVCTGLHIGR